VVDLIGEKETILSGVLVSLMHSIKFMYLSVAIKSLEIFDCTYQPALKGYMFELDPDRLCYTEKWWFDLIGLAVFSIIVFDIAFMVFVFWIEGQRNRIMDAIYTSPWRPGPFSQLILKLTYKKTPMYREGFEYWDSVILLRKLMIGLALMICVAQPSVQATLLIGIFEGCMAFQLYAKPYYNEENNTFELVTLASSIGVLYAGLTFMVADFNVEDTTILQWVVMLATLASTVWVIKYVVERVYNWYFGLGKSLYYFYVFTHSLISTPTINCIV
jgi:hypothetical protein